MTNQSLPPTGNWNILVVPHQLSFSLTIFILLTVFIMRKLYINTNTNTFTSQHSLYGELLTCIDFKTFLKSSQLFEYMHLSIFSVGFTCIGNYILKFFVHFSPLYFFFCENFGKKKLHFSFHTYLTEEDIQEILGIFSKFPKVMQSQLLCIISCLGGFVYTMAYSCYLILKSTLKYLKHHVDCV